MSNRTELRAPFPWYGGKSRAAHLVWPRFGDVPNYVEPFAGSLAVLLARPTVARTETVNDLDCYLANFWRATVEAPDEVARWADWPVSEADLHARHKWLVSRDLFRFRMRSEPDFFDAKIAGWWVWGICQWIGSGWCAAGLSDGLEVPEKRPLLKSGVGVNAERCHLESRVAGQSLWQKRPALGKGRRGVDASARLERLPAIATNGPGGKGVLRAEYAAVPTQIPQLSGDGSGNGRGVLSASISANLADYMMALRDRLRRVRVCCGDWRRILGPSPTTCIGVTGVFLDPPYSDGDRDRVYNHDSFSVAADVAAWCREHGDDPKLRIALCGYEGEHDLPGWDCVAWKANGGMGNQAAGRGRRNAQRERIWFSPHCERPGEDLFAGNINLEGRKTGKDA
jgi:hypothetical protein